MNAAPATRAASTGEIWRKAASTWPGPAAQPVRASKAARASAKVRMGRIRRPAQDFPSPELTGKAGLFPQQALAGQPGLEGGAVDGALVKVALRLVAAQRGEQRRLLRRLDALGDDLEAEVVAELDDHLRDARALAAGRELVDEAPVDLQ